MIDVYSLPVVRMRSRIVVEGVAIEGESLLPLGAALRAAQADLNMRDPSVKAVQATMALDAVNAVLEAARDWRAMLESNDPSNNAVVALFKALNALDDAVNAELGD